MASKISHHSDDDLQRILAHQKQRHLVAQLMTARRWVAQLEDLLVKGRCPTGYGVQLSPLSEEKTNAVSESAYAVLECFRRFVARHAPEQLAEAEQTAPQAETRFWARNRIRQLAETIEELMDELSALNETGELRQDISRLRHEIGPHIDMALNNLTTE